MAVGLLLLSCVLAAGQSIPQDSATKLVPDRLGDFRAAGPAVTPKVDLGLGSRSGATSIASRGYVARDGQKFWLTIRTAPSNSGAYALLTHERHSSAQSGNVVRADVGTAGFQFGDRIVFVKGPSLVIVSADDAKQNKGVALLSLLEMAKAMAGTLDQGEGDIPVLIKHLPSWESVYDRVLYAVDKDALKGAVVSQPVLDAVSFDGGAEAAVADYNGSKLVLVEFNTPQIASDNDQRISARLQELRNQGQALPTAYRRVGNYSVFVFDAPGQEAANQLIDQVKYQQMVQWLGKNPYLYDEAVREFSQTTLGVFVSVVKASGLVILGSLALGGFLGALLFTRRRAQQRAVQAYSDAGGMLRLNLDEITSRTDPARLMGRGN